MDEVSQNLLPLKVNKITGGLLSLWTILTTCVQ